MLRVLKIKFCLFIVTSKNRTGELKNLTFCPKVIQVQNQGVGIKGGVPDFKEFTFKRVFQKRPCIRGDGTSSASETKHDITLLSYSYVSVLTTVLVTPRPQPPKAYLHKWKDSLHVYSKSTLCSVVGVICTVVRISFLLQFSNFFFFRSSFLCNHDTYDCKWISLILKFLWSPVFRERQLYDTILRYRVVRSPWVNSGIPQKSKSLRYVTTPILVSYHGLSNLRLEPRWTSVNLWSTLTKRERWSRRTGHFTSIANVGVVFWENS